MNAPGTAGDTAWRIGQLDIDEVQHLHVELSAVAAELAQGAGVDWIWGVEDPTVVVVRALSNLAARAPHATSVRAADLCRRLDQDRAPTGAHAHQRRHFTPGGRP